MLLTCGTKTGGAKHDYTGCVNRQILALMAVTNDKISAFFLPHYKLLDRKSKNHKVLI